MSTREALLAPASLGADRFLAQPRGGGVRLSLPAAAVRAADRGLQREALRAARLVGAARGNAWLRLREHCFRRPCAAADLAPRARHPQADPLDAAADGRVPGRCARLDHDRVRAAGCVALRARTRAQVDALAGEPRVD